MKNIVLCKSDMAALYSVVVILDVYFEKRVNITECTVKRLRESATSIRYRLRGSFTKDDNQIDTDAFETELTLVPYFGYHAWKAATSKPINLRLNNKLNLISIFDEHEDRTLPFVRVRIEGRDVWYVGRPAKNERHTEPVEEK